MNSNKIIKLKLDIIFKAMFGTAENEQLLANFLSSILEIPRESIKKIIMDNVELIPDNYADKFSRVDLKMQVDDKIVNVELQINSEPDFAERTLYYWSRIYGSELKSGESYGKLKETICINIVNFNLFDCNEYHSHFKIMEKTRHEVLTNKFGIHFFELKKIGKHPDKNNHMQLWLQLINAETEEELDMLENTNVQEINQAIVVLRKLNADEKMRYLAEMREKSLHDEVSALEVAKEEGIAEGIQKGMAQGIEKGEKRKEDELIEKMRKSGLSDEMINNILNAK
ncbi:MAG: Rpn family recombination-promoting nuclease/putative transposase [Oscillospiraceae bacterium]|nr:Rpn family recombination-promoting nuclease/putative transposase [Oscillospiraceae bacterium]